MTFWFRMTAAEINWSVKERRIIIESENEPFTIISSTYESWVLNCKVIFVRPIKMQIARRSRSLWGESKQNCQKYICIHCSFHSTNESLSLSFHIELQSTDWTTMDDINETVYFA